ncbi:hypothetical protein GCM10027292_35730 [Hydrogenophaga aquatica]
MIKWSLLKLTPRQARGVSSNACPPMSGGREKRGKVWAAQRENPQKVSAQSLAYARAKPPGRIARPGELWKCRFG